MRTIPFRVVLTLIGLLVLLIQLLIVQALAQPDPVPPQTVVNYLPTTALFPNPERGLYHHYETYSSNFLVDPPLSLTTLRHYRHDENITLILRLYYLNSFTNTSISSEYLNFIRQEMALIRQAGLKVILRFAYSKNEAFPNNQDAAYPQVMAHLDQLQPVFSENSDVIALVQAGFIGAYGEWHAAHLDFGPPDDPNYDTRGAVLHKLLAELPSTRMVQLRTPRYKYHIFSDTPLCHNE